MAISNHLSDQQRVKWI